VIIWYIFPVLVFCTEKNLATLPHKISGGNQNCGLFEKGNSNKGKVKSVEIYFLWFWIFFWLLFYLIRGRCYMISILFHFRQFSAKKLALFLRNQCYDQILLYLALFSVTDANFFAIFWRIYFLHHNIGPG
jgi:hypothetical protein